MTPEDQSKTELDATISEALGETNKSPEQVARELEQSIISKFPPAPNLQGQLPDLHDTDVAIPMVVQDSLDEAIQKGEFPLSPVLIAWMESKVAEHNGVDPDFICAHPNIHKKGKMWDFYPEVATRFTGFTYYPPICSPS